MSLKGEFSRWETNMLVAMRYMVHYKKDGWTPESFGNASWWLSEPQDGRNKFIELTKKILTFSDVHHSAGQNTDYHTVFKHTKESLNY